MTRNILLIIPLIFPAYAYANFAWPPLFYMHTYKIWWVVLSCLTIEFIFYYLILERSFIKCAKLTLIVNAMSALGGVFFSISTTVALYIEFLLKGLLIISPLLIYLITIVIESFTAIKLLKYEKSKRLIITIALANIPSVGISIWQTIELTSKALSG